MGRRMSRPARIPNEIGAQIVRARKVGVPWKVLMDVYGLGRTRLWQLHREALANPEAECFKSNKNVHEHLGARQAPKRSLLDGSVGSDGAGFATGGTSEPWPTR